MFAIIGAEESFTAEESYNFIRSLVTSSSPVSPPKAPPPVLASALLRLAAFGLLKCYFGQLQDPSRDFFAIRTRVGALVSTVEF